MKRIAAVTLFTILAFATAGGALAQDLAVQANVPFAFTVGNQLLPPGNYYITTPSSGVIEVRGRNNSVPVLTTTTYNGKALHNGAKLVFTKYGSQLFLTQILGPNGSLNVSAPSSNQKKRTRQQEAMVETPSSVITAN